MPYILGMSLGAWIVLILIIVWAFIAIKVYFFGGFKRHKAHGGGCCDTGDAPSSNKTLDTDIERYCSLSDDELSASLCASCGKCDSPATRRNAVAPIVKEAPTSPAAGHEA